MELNQTSENQTTIGNVTTLLKKQNHTGRYSCKMCGNPIDAHPPDDVHKFCSVYQCWRFDWIERSYQCHKCNNSITLYWHPKAHENHYYATLQEIKSKIDKDKLGNGTKVSLLRMTGY
jgi:transcription elongation factor Elf1